MKSALFRGVALSAALSAVALISGCASGEAEARRQAEIEAARIAAELARTPPPIALNTEVAESASIYLAYIRDIQTLRGGFASPEDVQAALRRGAAYDPDQLSRGMVAYASILALQSPEFVAGVQAYVLNPTARDKMIADIIADPRYASYIPGAEAAAGLITETLRTDIQAMGRAADSIENDAYAIQAPYDPRQSWGRTAVADREGRLANAKTLSAARMLPSMSHAQTLATAARSGTGLGATPGNDRAAPYRPAVANALALAALAILGAAGEEGRPVTDRLQTNTDGHQCLTMSKLNLFQCLAASRPSYEDIFCIGRHAVRDVATCTSGAAMPAAIVTVSDLTATGPAPAPERPAIDPAPFEAPRAPEATTPIVVTPRPVQTPAAPPPPIGVRPTPSEARSATDRLNSAPPRSPGG